MRNLPQHLRPPFDNYKLESLFKEHYLYVFMYRCPLCQVYVDERPKEHMILGDLAMQLFEATGFLDEYAEKEFVILADGDVWSGIFSKNMDLL